MIDFYERSGLMQTAMIAENPRKQAISGRFWAGRTYRGRIKDDHKIENIRPKMIQFNASKMCA